MNNHQLILQALDLIEDRLTTFIPVAVLSQEMGYSLYHFTRLFHAVTGIAPGDYIARRKITEAALEIHRMSERSLIDISLDYNFNNYETFTRAFKRILNTTPSCIRNKRTEMKLLLLLPRLYEQDLLKSMPDRDLFPQLVDFGEIILQGPLVNVSNDFSVISNAWHLLFSKIDTLSNRMIPEQYFQLGYWPDDYESNGLSIKCACQLNPIDVDNNQEFPIHILPPIRYLKFIHKGRSCDIPSTYKYIYGIWLPKSEYRLSIPFELEYYGDLYLGPDNENSESEIYIPLELI